MLGMGSFCRRSFASASIRLPFRLFLPLCRCPFLMQGLLRKSHTIRLPLLLPPSLQKGGMGGGESRVALVLLPEVHPLLPLNFGPFQREGWRGLWSLVRCTRARFCLLGSFMDWGSRSCSLAANSCCLFCPGWFSLLISACSAR